MPPSWNDRGRSSVKMPVEEIDLTLSPSPEPQPRSRLSPRSNLVFAQPGPKYRRTSPIKMERRPSGVNMESGRRQSSTQIQTTHQPHIKPQDLAGIINTCDTNALRTVLLNLCKISPALSGAVARGLAPHSSYARNLIRQHNRPQFTRSHVKTERQGSPSTHSDSPDLLSSPQFTTLVKQQRHPSPAPSTGSSSTAFSDPVLKASLSPPPQAFPGSFPKSPERDVGRQPQSDALPFLRPHMGNSTNSSASSSRNVFSNTPSGFQHAQSNQATATKKCTRCEHHFLDGSTEDCFYHPGRKQVAVDVAGQRVVIYSCCHRSEWEAPCAIGSHVAPIVSALDSLKRSRPTSEPSPFLIRPQKNQKLWPR